MRTNVAIYQAREFFHTRYVREIQFKLSITEQNALCTMTDDSPFYILDVRRLLPAADAHLWLGRIVRSYQHPSATYTPSDPSSYTSASINETIINDLEAAVGACHDTALKTGLTNLASTMRGSGVGNTFTFETSSMKCLRLENYPKLFDAISQLDEVRKDLRVYLQPGGKPAYMITGLLTWTDPTFFSGSQERRTGAIEGKIPAGAIASTAVSGLPLPIDVGDPSVARSTRDESRKRMQGSMEGSYIFAVEYKAVRRKAYSLMKNFTAKLEDHGPRGKGDRIFGRGPQEEASEAKEEEEELDVSVDSDVVWTDTLISDEVGGLEDESTFKEVDFAGMLLVYEPPEK